jgi:ATP-dependent helicase/nuclease subunit A
MQFFDFDLVLKNGVEAEIERLAEKRFIFESDKEKMDIAKLKKFFESNLAKEMMRSRKLFREKRFMIKLPAKLFSGEDNELLEQEKLLVQGVIDCAFINRRGELILADYKTDYFKEGTPRPYIEKTLRERHGKQLTYYKLACKQLFDALPKHTYIYSFALDDTVEIFDK